MKPNIDPLELQRLLDGRLTRLERAAFLDGLDDDPDLWRTVALAFVEEQALRDAFSAPVTAVAATPAEPSRPEPRSRSTWLLTSVALTVFALTMGILVGRSRFLSGAGNDPSRGRAVESANAAAAGEKKKGDYYVVVTPPSDGPAKRENVETEPDPFDALTTPVFDEHTREVARQQGYRISEEPVIYMFHDGKGGQYENEMKRLLVPAMLVATLSSVAAAKDVDVEVRETVRESKGSESKAARVIIIDANGKKTELKLGKGALDSKAVKGLPKGLQIRVRKAVEEHTTKGDKGGKGKSVVRTYGKAVIIGPDGKKQEFEFGDEKVNEKVLKGLPKNIRLRIEKAIKFQDGKGAAGKQAYGKAVIIGPGGKKQEFEFSGKPGDKDFLKMEDVPKELRVRIEAALKAHGHKGEYKFNKSHHGTGVFIGPDGKKHEFQIKNGNWTIDRTTLQKMPKEAREKILDALMNKGIMTKSHVVFPGGGIKSQNDKLDLILKRLEKLEKQVQDLKKKVND
eukprot:g21457.t1